MADKKDLAPEKVRLKDNYRERIFAESQKGNYLIFYRPINQGIEVIRVIHGARDIQSLFEKDDE